MQLDFRGCPRCTGTTITDPTNHALIEDKLLCLHCGWRPGQDHREPDREGHREDVSSKKRKSLK